MSTTPCPGGVSAHPDCAAIDARLLAGETGAALHRSYPELTRKQLNDRARRLRKRKSTRTPSPATTTAIGPRVEIDGDRASAISRVYHDGDSMTEEDLLRGWKLDPDEWEIIPGTLGVNRWMQNAEDETWCYQYKAKLQRRSPDTVELQIAPPVTVKITSAARLPKRRRTELAVAVVYMDAQIGYWEDQDGKLHGIHDEAAIDISEQVTMDLQAESGIDVLVDVADINDLPQFSRHRTAKAFLTTRAMNAGTRRTGELLARRTALAPDAKRYVLRGNHDQRLTDWLNDHAPHLLGWRDANGELLISMDRIIGAEERGWEIVGDAYPTSCLWLNHNTRVIHGNKAGKGAAPAYLSEPVNTIFGHTPWVQMAHRTFALDDGGARTYVAAGGGGLMRVDGHLPPGIYSGVSETGGPGKGTAPWQQAMWVVTYDPDGHMVPMCEPVVIIDGWASFRGRVYQARCDADGNPVD